MKNINQLHNLSAVARKTGVPSKWLKKQVDKGLIPALRISKSRYLFNLKAVEQALLKLAKEGDLNE